MKVSKDKFIGKIIFNSYKIKKKLGEGAFGKVYIISNISTKELYAAKLVSKNIFIFKYFYIFRKKEKVIMIFLK